MQVALIAFGANLPWNGAEPEETVARAISELNSDGDRVVGQSRLYATPCFPTGAGPDYCNAAAAVETSRSPEDLLLRLQAIELAHGRERKLRWGNRTLDLDLLAIGETVAPDLRTFREWAELAPEAQGNVAPDQLVLPHPRMQDRAFVLVPLADIAPDWRHPVFGRTVADMLAGLPEADVRAVTPL